MSPVQIFKNGYAINSACITFVFITKLCQRVSSKINIHSRKEQSLTKTQKYKTLLKKLRKFYKLPSSKILQKTNKI